MAFDEAFAARIRDALARRRKVEEKKMFGGVGFLLNGNLLVGVWEDSLAIPSSTPHQGRTIAVVGDVYRFLATG